MKETIIAVSLEQFLLHGIRKMTIQQLIAPLGLSTKTVYKYFINKEALLEECLNLHYTGILQQLEIFQAQKINPILLLVQLYAKAIELDFKINPVFYYDLNHYYPDLQDKILKKNNKEFDSFLLGLIQNGKEQGYIRPTLASPLIAETLGILYRSLTRTDAFAKFELSPFEIAANTIDVYLRGICTEKGIQEINSSETPTELVNYKS
ncbi:TetR/AcrR family transcriptional regulator [Spirosoma migulaei]